METFLNLAWALLAMTGVVVWMRVEPRTGAERRLPFLALIMLLVILFPVISVSDDLWSIQNPAETDTLQRRDYLAPNVHPVFPVLVALPESVLSRLRFGISNISAPLYRPVAQFLVSALSKIENRPPPRIA
jgi:hypothetical protein